MPALVRAGARGVQRQSRKNPRLTLTPHDRVAIKYGKTPPDIMEFVFSDRYLNRPVLYPRQGTILKVMFLQDELFCADEQTEILTRSGWKRYTDLVVGEDVMTSRPDGLAEWAPAERVNVFPVQDQKMVSFESESHSSLTTGTHRWPVEHLYKRQAEWVWEKEFRTSDQVGTMDRLECAPRRVDAPEPSCDDAMVELVAWYWTEGHKRVGSPGVVITQSLAVNPKKVDRIRTCLTTLMGISQEFLWGADGAPAWRESQDGDMAVFTLNGPATHELVRIAPGAEKVVDTQWLMSLSVDQLNLYIEVSMAADGHYTATGVGSLAQKSKGRAEQFHLACTLAGVRAVLRERKVRGNTKYTGQPEWSVALRRTKMTFNWSRTSVSSSRRSLAKSEVTYTGDVWCPTTKNGTWLAKRNGTIYFTGNTDYDYDVIGEWEETFLREGNEGCSPGLLERIRINKADGRKWFRETQGVIGRRGSKGFLGGIANGYVLYNFMWVPGGPQAHYGIDRDKKIRAIVFAGKRQQAKENQWQDINDVITGAPCFSRWISRPLGESLSVYAPSDLLRLEEQERMGVVSDADQATFVIVPKESTLQAGRGPATYAQFYDEMAHVVATGANRDAEDVWGSATPALDQFKKDGFIYEPSSPWQQTGQFYVNWQQAIEMNADGSPAYPEKWMVQLPSWGPYQDWADSERIPIRQPKITVIDTMRETEIVTHFQAFDHAIQEYDDGMKQIERANPETFAVERRSHWSQSLAAYLNKAKVDEMFRPWNGEAQVMKAQGIMATTYKAHGDPSSSGANFGFAIAHAVKPEGSEMFHVVFDVIHSWRPAHFEDGIIDYIQVQQELEEYARAFMPSEMTFDQFNVGPLLSHLRGALRTAGLPKMVRVREETSTAPHNWKRAEIFKSALNMGLVHAPIYDVHGQPSEHSELAEMELRFLENKNGKVDHPTSGPVQTKDIADCFDDQTEVLTEHGWKLFADVQGGERVATRTPDGNLEYQHFTDRVDRQYTGPMVAYHGLRTDFVVTPGHRMLVHPRGRAGYRPEALDFRRADSLGRGTIYFSAKTTTVDDAGRSAGAVDIDFDTHHSHPLSAAARGGYQRRWSVEEDVALASAYSTMEMPQIHALLPGRSQTSIYIRARKRGLTRGQIGDRHGDRPVSLPVVDRRLFAKFLGFWLAEGRKYHSGTHKGYGVKITQTKPAGIAWFDAVLAEMGWPASRTIAGNGETVWNIYSHGLREYLRAMCVGDHELVLPDEVFTEWTSDEMEGLLEGLCWGDGNFSAAQQCFTNYSSISKRLVDDVQRLMAHLGKSGQVRMVKPAGTSITGVPGDYVSKHAMWAVHFDNKPYSLIKGRLLDMEQYEGRVYCLTVPNSTLLTRRSGSAMWAGNCIMECVYALVGEQMAIQLGEAFSGLGIRGSLGGGMDPYSNQIPESERMGDRLAGAMRGVNGRRGMGTSPSRGLRRR